MEITHVDIKCPYCGDVQTHYLKESHNAPQVYFCSVTPNDEGCDRFFVGKVVVEFNVTTKKIEGDGIIDG